MIEPFLQNKDTNYIINYFNNFSNSKLQEYIDNLEPKYIETLVLDKSYEKVINYLLEKNIFINISFTNLLDNKHYNKNVEEIIVNNILYNNKNINFDIINNDIIVLLQKSDLKLLPIEKRIDLYILLFKKYEGINILLNKLNMLDNNMFTIEQINKIIKDKTEITFLQKQLLVKYIFDNIEFLYNNDKDNLIKIFNNKNYKLFIKKSIVNYINNSNILNKIDILYEIDSKLVKQLIKDNSDMFLYELYKKLNKGYITLNSIYFNERFNFLEDKLIDKIKTFIHIDKYEKLYINLLNYFNKYGNSEQYNKLVNYIYLIISTEYKGDYNKIDKILNYITRYTYLPHINTIQAYIVDIIKNENLVLPFLNITIIDNLELKDKLILHALSIYRSKNNINNLISYYNNEKIEYKLLKEYKNYINILKNSIPNIEEFVNKINSNDDLKKLYKNISLNKDILDLERLKKETFKTIDIINY